MGSYIKYKNQYFILASSSLADDRIMVLKHEDMFGVFDRYGDVFPIGHGAQGLFCEGTRFLSKLEMLIEGHRPLLLSSSLKEENELMTVDLTNSDYLNKNGSIAEKGSLHIHRAKFVYNNVCYEKIRLCNFGMEPLSFNLSLSFDSDFKDIFEVRGLSRKKAGRKATPKYLEDQIILSYKGLDNVSRKTRIKFEEAPFSIESKKVFYKIQLAPKACDYISFAVACEIGKKETQILKYEDAYNQVIKTLEKVKEESCELLSSNEQFNEWLHRSKSDLITMISNTEYGIYPYAGIPWYSTPFGRDGIITAWQCLWLNPDITKGVLKYLAATQADSENSFQDAEPGKIFHEKRGGEMAELGEIPFKLYYGTIDATPLFVALAGAYLQRTNDLETLRHIWSNIEAALKWIDNFGDIDGDGFVEYQKKSESGLNNQGWKDSHDSIFYSNGKLAKGPIALCEVQGYVYDAKISASMIARELGMEEKAEELSLQANELKEKFARSFWSEEKKCYYIALDGQKNPCDVVSSNAGHCLFSGIAQKEHAEQLACTLLNDKMFSGWGIRTIASDEFRYNPMSYHNGSIWPHDNSLIAYGLYRYGFYEEVHKVLKGMFDVTTFVELQRLPELFCGFEKRKNEGPTAYPVACSPQAWAVTSVYFLLQASLGIEINAKENTINFVNPTLPSFINELTITNLEVNNTRVVIQIRRNLNNEIDVYLLHKDGDVKVKKVENEDILIKKNKLVKAG